MVIKNDEVSLGSSFNSDQYYLFSDMTTLKIIIIPMINKSFNLWHLNEKKFDSIYDKYYGNISTHEESMKHLKETEYLYCVYIGKGSTTTKDNFHISGTYYLITEKETGISTVLFVQ